MYSFATGHVRRDLWARAAEWRDIPHSIWEHVRLRFPKGDAARRYNVLQKLAYLSVIFVVLPIMILTGMTMSPGLDARFVPAPELERFARLRQHDLSMEFLSAACEGVHSVGIENDHSSGLPDDASYEL